VTRTLSGPGRWPHQFAQNTTRSAASGLPGASTTGLSCKVGTRTSRTGRDVPSARTMVTVGRPRRMHGPEPMLVNSMSPWTPRLSPSRPALIRSAVLAQLARPHTGEVVGCPVPGEVRPGPAGPPAAAQPASARAAQLASQARRLEWLASLPADDALNVTCLRTRRYLRRLGQALTPGRRHLDLPRAVAKDRSLT